MPAKTLMSARALTRQKALLMSEQVDAAAEPASQLLPVFGFDAGPLVFAVLALAAAVVLRSVVVRGLRFAMDRIAARTETPLDDKVGAALEPPLGLLPIALGVFAAGRIIEPTGLAALVTEGLVRSIVCIAFFWALLRLVEPVYFILKDFNRVLTPEMRQWVVKALRILVWLVGGATLLELWGVRVLPIIAGLGLVGVAVALGAQDLFKNLISGVLVLTERRFRVGDWVRIEGVVEGTVEEINFRSTKVRRFDKAPVYVPNTAFADGAVVNFGEMTHRRISWTIGLEYRATHAQLSAIREKVEAYISADARYLSPPDASRFVRLSAFSDSSVDLMIYCFTKTRDWGDWLEIKEELLLEIKKIVEGEGAGFAFPSRSLYVETGDDAAFKPAPPPPAGAAEATPRKSSRGRKPAQTAAFEDPAPAKPIAKAAAAATSSTKSASRQTSSAAKAERGARSRGKATAVKAAGAAPGKQAAKAATSLKADDASPS